MTITSFSVCLPNEPEISVGPAVKDCGSTFLRYQFKTNSENLYYY